LAQISPLESALTDTPPVTPLESALTETPGGGGRLRLFRVSVSPCLCLPRPCRGGKSHVLSSLQPLVPLFALFSALPSFVFKSLQPLFPKHPGWGYPNTSAPTFASAVTCATWRLYSCALIRLRILPVTTGVCVPLRSQFRSSPGRSPLPKLLAIHYPLLTFVARMIAYRPR